MGYFDEMEQELLGEQEKKQENLNLKKKTQKKKTSKAKVDLHVTIPEDLKKQLEAKAQKEHRSLAVMLEIILEQGLNKS